VDTPNNERGHTSIGSLFLGLEECPQLDGAFLWGGRNVTNWMEPDFGVGGMSPITDEVDEVIESGKRIIAKRKDTTTL
jgi:hypothetical protein